MRRATATTASKYCSYYYRKPAIRVKNVRVAPHQLENWCCCDDFSSSYQLQHAVAPRFYRPGAAAKPFSTGTNIHRTFQDLLERINQHSPGHLPLDLSRKARTAFGNVPHEEAIAASQVWERLLEEHVLSDKKNVANIHLLNSVMAAFQPIACSDIAARAEDLVSSLEHHMKVGKDVPHPTLRTYTILMDLWAKSPSLHNGERAERLLSNLTDKKMSNLVAFNTALSAWSISTHPQAAERTESLLRTMPMSPDVISFSCAIGAWSQYCQRISPKKNIAKGDEKNTAAAWEAALRAKALFHEMQQPPLSLAPDAPCLNGVLEAFSNCASFHAQASMQAQALLEEALRCNIPTNEDCWHTILWTWAKTAATAGDRKEFSTAREAAQQTSKLLANMQILFEKGQINVPPTTRGYAAAILAHAKAGEPSRAEQLLKQALDLPPNTSRETTFLIPISSWNAVLQSWMIHSPNDSGCDATATSEPHPAFQLLRFMQRQLQDHTVSISMVNPDELTYIVVLQSLARIGDTLRAQNIYKEFLDYEELCTSDFSTAHASAFAALLSAFCKTEVEHAEQLLLKSTLDKDKAHLLSSACFNVVMDAWVKANDPGRARSILRRQKRLYEETLEESVFPDATGYTIVMAAFAREGNIERVEQLWNELLAVCERFSNPKFQPTTVCFNALLEAYSQIRETEKAETLLLQHIESHADASSYSIILNSWAKRGRAKEAESLLIQLRGLHKDRNRSIAPPDSHCFSAAINGWSKSNDPYAAERAEAILMEMIDSHKRGDTNIYPDTVCFNAAINTWSRSSKQVADQRALRLLKLMMDLHETKHIDCQPDKVSFSSVLQTLSRSKRADRVKHAEELMKQMQRLHKHGNLSAKPDTIVYNTLLNVIGQSRDPDRVFKSCSLLDQMENSVVIGDENVRPDTRSYNAVILCCAYSKTEGPTAQESVLHVATEVLIRARGNSQINSFTYDAFFKAIALLAKGKERAELVQKTFEMCCEDGHLNDMVLKSLESAAPSRLLGALLPTRRERGRVRIQDLPSSFSISVERMHPHKSKMKK